jgi:hypothetical protein
MPVRITIVGRFPGFSQSVPGYAADGSGDPQLGRSSVAQDEAKADVPAHAVPADVSSLRGDAVGRVLGTQAASPLSFWVGLEPGSVLQLDDVVVTWRDVPGRGRVLVAGVVTNVEARYASVFQDLEV